MWSFKTFFDFLYLFTTQRRAACTCIKTYGIQMFAQDKAKLEEKIFYLEESYLSQCFHIFKFFELIKSISLSLGLCIVLYKYKTYESDIKVIKQALTTKGTVKNQKFHPNFIQRGSQPDYILSSYDNFLIHLFCYQNLYIIIN